MHRNLNSDEEHPYPPSHYVALFNEALDSIAELVVQAKYLQMDWPAPEFAVACPGLPPLYWNKREFWEYVVGVLDHLKLPSLSNFFASEDVSLWEASRVTHMLVCYAQKLSDIAPEREDTVPLIYAIQAIVRDRLHKNLDRVSSTLFNVAYFW